MILSDRELSVLLVGADKPLVYPLASNGLQPASVDIRLGKTFLKPISADGEVNQFDKKVKYREYSGEVVIHPHEFLLATTIETVTLPDNLTAFVEGRSSIGRMGLFIQNAGWVDPGFCGKITLELFNASDVPILLKEGTRVGQLVFCKMSTPCRFPYRGKYQYQSDTTGSRINFDPEVYKGGNSSETD